MTLHLFGPGSDTRPMLPILSGVTDDRAAEPGSALPLDDADDARLSLLAAPLAGPAPAPHAGTRAEVAEVEQDVPVDRSPGADDAEAETRERLDAGQPGDEQADDEQADDEQPDDVPASAQTTVLSTVGATLPMWLPATAPPVAGPRPAPVVSPEPPPVSVARHRRQPWALLVLSILLALTLGLATYLLMTTRAHESRSAEWESLARSTGVDLTQARADLEATTNDLAATRDQLATAQVRIIELADEKAQLGDDRAVQRQLVDYQQRISAAAGNVATALTSCIDGQYKLIGYLENPSAYDQADLARFRTDVKTVCGAATDANTALQRELKK